MRTMRGLGVAAMLAILTGACSDDGAEPTGAGGATTSAGGGQTGVGGAGGANCFGTETDDPRLAEALQVLRDALHTEEVPGGAIAIVKDGQLLGLGVTGSKNAVSCDPITPDTLFGAAFATQIVTAIAALDAVEDGTLSLTAPITDYVPALSVQPGRGDVNAITLQHLLVNSSMYRSGSSANPLQATCTTLAGAFESAVNPEIQAPPGSMNDPIDWNNYEIAGLALQNADGVPFADAVAARVLEPLGMGGTFDPEVIAASDHASAYAVGGIEQQPDVNCPNHAPALGYHGNVGDFAKLLEYLTGGAGNVLEPALRSELLTNQGPNFWSCMSTPYGFLQTVQQPSIEPPDEMLWTDGYAQGFTSQVVVLKQRGLAVVTLMNAAWGYGPSYDVTRRVVEIYDPTATVAMPSDLLADSLEPPDPTLLPSLVGTYHDDFGFDGATPRSLEVSLDPDDPTRLVGTLTGMSSDPEPVSFERNWCNDNYVATVSNFEAAIRFWRDDVTGNGGAVQIFGDSGPPLFRVP